MSYCDNGSAIVSFDFASFAARFPEFASIDPALAQMYFDEATIFFNNQGYGAASTPAIQSALLNLLVAHLCWLQLLGPNGQPINGGLVGPINHASEGSVSVGTMIYIPPGTAAWFCQTKYGYEFWAGTSIYRRFRYRRGPDKQRNPYAFP
jgi:hypothetical protein